MKIENKKFRYILLWESEESGEKIGWYKTLAEAKRDITVSDYTLHDLESLIKKNAFFIIVDLKKNHNVEFDTEEEADEYLSELIYFNENTNYYYPFEEVAKKEKVVPQWQLDRWTRDRC